MERGTYLIPEKLNLIPSINYSKFIIKRIKTHNKSALLVGRVIHINHPHLQFSIKCSSSDDEKDELPPIARKSSNGVRRNPRRLIKLATSDGKWHDKWTSDYIFTLQDLQLADLSIDGQRNAKVLITLTATKHSGFGFSVEGRIVTSFTRKCTNCSSSYHREINTTFDVWVLPSTRENRSSSTQLPEIGGDDPSVIYVKPGCEADLDSLIRDTIRLTTSAKDTCSESCEKAEPRLHYIGGKEASAVDGRWSRLLELKKKL
ncbi:hypothetical protein MKW92_007302 [Papaver armeniacum]|nr:hypothetical protein MKW92_007302 [Papaver armeniacum]